MILAMRPLARCDVCPAYGCTMCQHDIDAIRERFERGDGMATYVLPDTDPNRGGQARLTGLTRIWPRR